jgi:DNA-binding CsgD family transcriptional regulator
MAGSTRSQRRTPDVLSVIEAAYRIDAPPDVWLKALADTIYGQIGVGHGLFGFCYDVSEQCRLSVRERVEIGMPEGLDEQMTGNLEALPDWYIRGTFVRCDAGTSSHIEDARIRELSTMQMDALAQMFGWRDIFIVSGMDPSRHGVYFGAWLDKQTKLGRVTHATWARVAVHLAAAYRLRRRLAPSEASRAETADAVLSPAGRIEHAQNEAQPSEARHILQDAVVTVERARGRVRRESPERAVAAWPGLVSGRWTLVDHFESDGKRYVLARKNDVALTGFAALSLRERQALGYAALGHTNKLIAYEMGISASTVSVLLHRAAKKLGAETRGALIERYQAGLGS